MSEDWFSFNDFHDVKKGKKKAQLVEKIALSTEIKE